MSKPSRNDFYKFLEDLTRLCHSHSLYLEVDGTNLIVSDGKMPPQFTWNVDYDMEAQAYTANYQEDYAGQSETIKPKAPLYHIRSSESLFNAWRELTEKTEYVSIGHVVRMHQLTGLIQNDHTVDGGRLNEWLKLYEETLKVMEERDAAKWHVKRIKELRDLTMNHILGGNT